MCSGHIVAVGWEHGQLLAPRTAAEALRALHVPGRPLLLVNAWDAASAVVIARCGAPAIATTSAGAANALGYPDGQAISRDEMLASVARIAAVVDLPVTADMEAGYGDDAEDAAATARGVIAAGAVGLNLEDTAEEGDDPLLPIDRFVAKIAAIRAVASETGVPLVLNARTDVFIEQVGDPATRLERRSNAGAPTSRRAPTASSSRPSSTRRRSTRSSPGSAAPSACSPSPGSPTPAELAAIGVARISVGSGPYRAALALTEQIAKDAYGAGSLDALTRSQISFAGAQALFDR